MEIIKTSRQGTEVKQPFEELVKSVNTTPDLGRSLGRSGCRLLDLPMVNLSLKKKGKNYFEFD